MRDDRGMATTTCGWCSRDVHMTQLTRHPQVQRQLFGDGYVSDAAYKCDNPKCGRYSVVTWYSSNNPSDTWQSGEPEDYDRTTIWSPPPIKRPVYEDVPDYLAAAAREAWLCHAHGAYIAACAVARAVIEASAKTFEITMNGIFPKIEELASRNLIWGDLIESAHVVRQFGNDASHGDIVQPVPKDEAEDVLDIMDELLHQLFVSPARSKRLRKSRAERRSEGE